MQRLHGVVTEQIEEHPLATPTRCSQRTNRATSVMQRLHGVVTEQIEEHPLATSS